MGERVVGKVVRFLSSYLDDYPDAVDSADGILRWWLPRQDIDATPEEVQRALDQLVSNGVVERHAAGWTKRVCTGTADVGGAHFSKMSDICLRS